MPTYDARSKYTMSTNSSCFPVVETSIPRLIAVSVRVVSLKVGTYLNVTAALARATRSDTRTPEQDRMEALTEVLATEIEVCGDVNLGTGKVCFLLPNCERNPNPDHRLLTNRMSTA